MKKFFAALLAVLMCFTMVIGAAAADSNVAVPERQPEITEEVPLEETIGGFIDKLIGENKEEVEDTTISIENISSTLSQILNSLDEFLRGLRLFVDQFLSKVLGNGSLPF